jgi:phage baseplate assembly protein gpV
VVVLSPKGAKPGAVKADIVEATAKVEALDAKNRKVSLRYPDGDRETYDVRKDVDMSQAHLGQEVLIRSTEAVAISFEKP